MNIIADKTIRYRREKFLKTKDKLEKVNIDDITENITKNCWNYNIQYGIILKTSNLLIIKLKGAEKTILLKYHKKERIQLEEYEGFLQLLNRHNIGKGIYITTGIFVDRIAEFDGRIFGKRVQRVDGYRLMKNQISIKRLNFLEYLP